MTGDATAERGIGALEIATRSGAVVIWARPIARAEVVGGAAEIDTDGVVRSRRGSRVEIACPEGSDVIIGSSSGRVECHRPLGRVAITGASGRISIDEARVVEVRPSSGRRMRERRFSSPQSMASSPGRVVRDGNVTLAASR